ncbi:MAG TPA: hypothetical protein PLS93_02570 [Accumulibacter sp.]|nr:hypothetical protein [Accumulibacter sp.]
MLAAPIGRIEEEQRPRPIIAGEEVAVGQALDPDTKTYLWAMFQDSIKVRGLTGALNLLPEAKRTTYRAWLKQHPVPWWNPQAIWMQWDDYIADLRISDPEAWT